LLLAYPEVALFLESDADADADVVVVVAADDVEQQHNATDMPFLFLFFVRVSVKFQTNSLSSAMLFRVSHLNPKHFFVLFV